MTIWPLSHNPKPVYDRKAALKQQKDRFDASVKALNDLKARYPGCGGVTLSESAEGRWAAKVDKEEGRV